MKIQLLSVSQVYWNTAMFIRLHTVCGHFRESSSCDRDCVACKAANIYYLAVDSESVPTVSAGRKGASGQRREVGRHVVCRRTTR